MDNNFLERARENADNLPEVKTGNNGSEAPVPESFYHNITSNDGESQRYDELFDKDKKKTRVWSVVSLTLGILSVSITVLFTSLSWFALTLGIAAIVFAIVSRVSLKYFDGMTVAGLILGIFGVVFGCLVIAVNLFIASEAFSELLQKYGY